RCQDGVVVHRKGPSKASVPIFEGPSVQGLLDWYGYNTTEEYLSWNYFPSTDKDIIDKDIIDEDCIHESNYAMSKGCLPCILHLQLAFATCLWKQAFIACICSKRGRGNPRGRGHSHYGHNRVPNRNYTYHRGSYNGRGRGQRNNTYHAPQVIISIRKIIKLVPPKTSKDPVSVSNIISVDDDPKPKSVVDCQSPPDWDEWKDAKQAEINSFNKRKEIQEVIVILKKEFEMKDLGKTKYCLGLQIEHMHNRIIIHQSNYTEKLLKRFNMDKEKPLSTPMVGRSLNVDNDPFLPCEDDEEVLGPVRYQKQTLIATSSNQAEVIALHEASRECVWFRSMTQLILTSCGLEKDKNPTLIYEGNSTCVSLMKEGYVKSDRIKHIPPRFFSYAQDLIKDNQVEMRYVQSSNNSTDLFTKALLTTIFKEDVHNIRMRHVRRM
nr:copia-type Pol polyprotein-like [Tanacetum cinerariifolium]